jgi:hypothetical protein
MKINWVGDSTDSCYFNDLEINNLFVIDSHQSLGAVYKKVKHSDNNQYYQLEVQTGLLFKPTSSRVKLVQGELIINRSKPSIYK